MRQPDFVFALDDDDDASSQNFKTKFASGIPPFQSETYVYNILKEFWFYHNQTKLQK